MQSIVRGFATDLTRPRKYNYSQESLEEFLLNNPEVVAQSFRLPNPRAHQLQVLLLKHPSADTCILYAHGLGSNKLEALPIAKSFLKQGCDVCSFDFSGSGRSEGTMTTYGIYEKEDVTTVLKHIEKNCGYERVVLWGRSMGAVSVVLAHSQNQSSKVECLVLDSPFSSFEKVALQTASKKSFVPQFMISMVMDPLKKYFIEHMDINPFTIDLEKALSTINTRMLLIYSLKDSVVDCSHAQEIVRHCRRNPQQIVIKEDHNMQRSKSTFAKTLKFIRDSAREAERKVVLSRSKNRGISITSKDPKQRESVRSGSDIRLVSTCKIRLVNASSSKVSVRQQSIGKNTDRCVRTIASLSESIQYSKRTQTEISPTRRKMGAICSVYFENKYPETKIGLNCRQNKENIKPSLNMLRRNRFR